MTSKGSKKFYDLVGPDVARHIAEGGWILGPAVKVSLGYRDGNAGFVFEDISGEWFCAGEKFNQILYAELDRLPAMTKTGLAGIIRSISSFVPDEPLALFRIEVWFSVPDGGGTRVEVIARLSLAAAGIPDVAKAAVRARDRVLEEVCKE